MIPVITIDGPSGTGKGTVAAVLARRLGWHCLDSGALYRVLGLAAELRGLDPDRAEPLAELAGRLPLRFADGRVLLDGDDVSDRIRTETAGMAASRVSVHPQVRDALLAWQQDAVRPPGLVADGRDMGTVVFPGAPLKIFLDASADERALRRYKQLKEKGLDANLPALLTEIEARDDRDRNRAVAPLKAADDALVLDTTDLSVTEVSDRVLQEVRRLLPDLVF